MILTVFIRVQGVILQSGFRVSFTVFGLNLYVVGKVRLVCVYLDGVVAPVVQQDGPHAIPHLLVVDLVLEPWTVVIKLLHGLANITQLLKPMTTLGGKQKTVTETYD